MLVALHSLLHARQLSGAVDSLAFVLPITQSLQVKSGSVLVAIADTNDSKNEGSFSRLRRHITTPHPYQES